MVIYNAATRELTAKIVYYGPGLCGKTTNLKVLHDRLEPGTAGKLLNLQTQSDRTIYFDLLPVELGDIKGYKIRFQLATVPGQTAFNETRRVVLKGVDGIVFVADSQWTMLPKNLESWQNLKDNLKANGIGFESVPVIVQYNKRDLGDILAVDAMQEALGLSSYPFVEAVASAGRGVTETFKLISKLTFVDLLRRLQGRRAEEANLPAPVEPTSAADDLQTWKDSLLNRESQPAVPVSRPQRPLSLVPPVSDDAPFDTTELARGVDDDEDGSPYEVPAPPMGSAYEEPSEPPPPTPASTIRMEAVRIEDPAEPPAAPPDEAELEIEEPAEVLSPADEVAEYGDSAAGMSTDPSFFPPDTVRDERIELLENRLREMSDRSSSAEVAAERLQGSVASLESQVASVLDRVGGMAERMQELERGVSGLQQALSAATERLASNEEASRRQGDLEAALRRLEAGLVDADERFLADQGRQRKDADDIAMALRGLTERAQATDERMDHLHQAAGSHEEALASQRGELERLRALEAHVDGLRDAAERLSGLEGALGGLHDAADRVRALEGAVGPLQEAADRVRSLEGRISGVEGLAERTPALEDQISSLRAALERLPALEAQISALRDSGERLPGLEQRAESLQRDLRELESTLEEKTHQGRREAEDIRSQIAPLLEERVRRHESDAMLFAEMERLRESLAESLHDIAERVRSRVRE